VGGTLLAKAMHIFHVLLPDFGDVCLSCLETEVVQLSSVKHKKNLSYQCFPKASDTDEGNYLCSLED